LTPLLYKSLSIYFNLKSDEVDRSYIVSLLIALCGDYYFLFKG